jgi:hypothetical protein
MNKLLRSITLICAFLATTVLPSRGQVTTPPAADSNAPTGQVPDEAMKKLSDLVHAGKYAEAQQLTAGLLLAYPEDQRLLKAKTLLDKSLATAGPATVTPDGNLPVDNVASVPPAASTRGEPLTGLDKVDFNALIELARQAQQNTDLEQQNVSLRQFMDQSSPFLQKHPAAMLLWQLRAASAISLHYSLAGYEAGQKLLASGAADSKDPNLQRLLAQLKNIGWLDRESAEKAKYDWIVGAWSVSFSYLDAAGHRSGHASFTNVELSKSGSVIEGYSFDSGPVYRGTILDSGKIRWEWTENRPEREPAWMPAISFESSEDKGTMTIVFPTKVNGPYTLLFTRISTKK